MIRSISHVALRVDDLIESERYYCSLFGLEVAFRDLTVDGVQCSLPIGKTWKDAVARGHTPGLSALSRDGLFLSLEQSPGAGSGDLDHIGFAADAAELTAQRTRLEGNGCTVVAERDDILVFSDRFGLHWELTTTSLENATAQSTGARLGKWLNLG